VFLFGATDPYFLELLPQSRKPLTSQPQSNSLLFSSIHPGLSCIPSLSLTLEIDPIESIISHQSPSLWKMGPSPWQRGRYIPDNFFEGRLHIVKSYYQSEPISAFIVIQQTALAGFQVASW
jgi:hypothetical protein